VHVITQLKVMMVVVVVVMVVVVVVVVIVVVAMQPNVHVTYFSSIEISPAAAA
jgi:hypothetical protein